MGDRIYITDANEVIPKIIEIISNAEQLEFFSLDLFKAPYEYQPGIYYELTIKYGTEHNKNFKFCHLAESALIIHSAEDIINMIPENCQRLELSKMRKLFSIQTISDFMKKNKTLRELYVSENNFTDDDAIEISKGLFHNKALRTIHLLGSEFSDTSREMIYDAMVTSPYFSLNYFDMIYNKNDLQPLRSRIIEILRNNGEIWKRLEGKKVDRRTTLLYKHKYLRVYNYDVKTLESFLSRIQNFGRRRCKGFKHVFIYNTPLNLEFLTKWFGPDTIGENLESLGLVNCTVLDDLDNPSTDFFNSPDIITKFPKLRLINIIT